MNCPHHILINRKYLYICIQTDHDYNRKRWVPMKMWLNAKRYQIMIFGRWINKDNKYVVHSI